MYARIVLYNYIDNYLLCSYNGTINIPLGAYYDAELVFANRED